MALWPLHSSAQFARDRTGFADDLAREHTTILEGDKFVWADSAYPVELSC